MNVKVVVDFAKLGAIVKAKRLELDWSTSKLANISGVSATRINQLENNSPTEYTGKIRRPKEETVTKIARALRLSDDELLTLAGYRVKRKDDEPEAPEEYDELAVLYYKWRALTPEQQKEAREKTRIAIRILDEEIDALMRRGERPPTS